MDGDLRLTYEQFFDRCDRWSSALQQLGVAAGDRVATIAPNTHAQLEAFYAVPQIGAVLVPINYRLTAEDFVYIINHSGASVVCVDADYLDAVDSVRDQLPGVRHFVAFEGARDGWLDYEAAIAAASPGFTRADVNERDLLTINYTSGTTARPKGVMITHRNAMMNSIGTLLHLRSRWANGICGRCRCFTRTAGHIPGPSPAPRRRMSACARSSQARCSSSSARSGSAACARPRPC